MLKLFNISKTFNPGTITEKKALKGIDLELDDGDFVTVIGGNGAGKSTLLNLIAGVHSTDTGSIFLDGLDLTDMPEFKRAKYLGRVFQDPMMGTAANMEIEENLAMAMRRGKKRGLSWHIQPSEEALYTEKLKLLDLGLENRRTAKVGLLSGGQRHPRLRAAVAAGCGRSGAGGLAEARTSGPVCTGPCRTERTNLYVAQVPFDAGGGRSGRDAADKVRTVPARVVAGRTAGAVERPEGRDVARRAASAAGPVPGPLYARAESAA